MTERADAAWVRDLIGRTQYIVLATTDGDSPRIAPVEPLLDEDLNFYFFSTSEARHSRHIEEGGKLAAVMFDTEQPEYTPSLTANLNAVQMECSARSLDPSEYNEAVRGAIDALERRCLPMRSARSHPPASTYPQSRTASTSATRSKWADLPGPHVCRYVRLTSASTTQMGSRHLCPRF